MRDWSLIAVIAYGVSWVIFIGALFVVPRNRRPSAATAWLMLIFLLPYLGLLIFLLFGSPKLSRRRREQQRTMNQYLTERAETVMLVAIAALASSCLTRTRTIESSIGRA